MNRDEFMELVYETFADEPDNVLANGIIEAADAYAEHEKAQLSHESTTSDTISRTEVVEHLRRMLEATVPNTDYDEGYIDGIEFGISTVSTMPTIQPEPTDEQVEEYCKRRCLHIVTDDFCESTKPQRLGHWIQYDKRFPWRHHYKCSECGNYLDFSGVNGGRGEANYCPKCGVKMKGAQNG